MIAHINLYAGLENKCLNHIAMEGQICPIIHCNSSYKEYQPNNHHSTFSGQLYFNIFNFSERRKNILKEIGSSSTADLHFLVGDVRCWVIQNLGLTELDSQPVWTITEPVIPYQYNLYLIMVLFFNIEHYRLLKQSFLKNNL